MGSDGYDMVAPSGEGGQRCMKMAMAMADKLGGEKKVDYVNTHGTSTPVGDTMELAGIKTVFTEAGYQPFIGSTKSLSGHALGAAGVHEAIYCMLVMQKGFLAESANINDLMDEAEGMNILTKRHEGEVNRVMSNSFGFGGTNACLVFDKYTEWAAAGGHEPARARTTQIQKASRAVPCRACGLWDLLRARHAPLQAGCALWCRVQC